MSDLHTPPLNERPVRSFVRREGRLTRAQQRALDHLWPRFGIPEDGDPPDLDALFEHRAPTVLEIGFGNGDNLAEMAGTHPELNFIGIEVHRPGVGHLLQLLERGGLSNVRVMMGDALELLRRRVKDRSLARIMVLFPDPWPKRRHHKRRLIRPEFLELAATRLQTDGILQLATDWEDYAAHIDQMMHDVEAFAALSEDTPPHSSPIHRSQTRFERRGLRLGHRIHERFFLHRPPIPAKLPP